LQSARLFCKLCELGQEYSIQGIKSIPNSIGILQLYGAKYDIYDEYIGKIHSYYGLIFIERILYL
jgi:hypothetical protein